MKKHLSILLVFAMMIVMLNFLTLTALATETSGTTGDCTWEINGTELTVFGNGDMGDYDEQPWGFDVTKVTILSGVTSIGDEAFFGCTRLENITIPNSVTHIGNSALSYCIKLKTITIPTSVTHIGKSAFEGCENLKVVRIPDGITDINWATFSCCGDLESVIIPNSITHIDHTAFDFCYALKNVYYGGSSADWNEIEIGIDNECLTDASLTYNSTGEEVELEETSAMPESATEGVIKNEQTENLKVAPTKVKENNTKDEEENNAASFEGIFIAIIAVFVVAVIVGICVILHKKKK